MAPRLLTFLVFVLFPWFGVEFGFASEGRLWAVLVGVEEYRHAPKLDCAVSDIRAAREALIQHCAVMPTRILEITDSAEVSPTSRQIKKSLTSFLTQLSDQDQILFYFVGYGIREDDEEYLATIDTDLANPKETAVAVSWLTEQLAKVQPKGKVLILDVRGVGKTRRARGLGAGTAFDPDKRDERRPAWEERLLAAAEIGHELVRTRDAVVLCSTADRDDDHLIFDDPKQSLFSYWLVRGLRGRNDLNRDGAVDRMELADYLQRNVSRVAKRRFERQQQPVVFGDYTGRVCRPTPRLLRECIRESAEQLAEFLADENIKHVGVLDEFGGPFPHWNDHGYLGKWCSATLIADLTEYGKDSFYVHRRPPGDRLVDGRPGMIVEGNFDIRTERVVGLQCVLRSPNLEPVETVYSSARLTDEEWAMMGKSGVRPAPSVEAAPAQDLSKRIIEGDVKPADPVESDMFTLEESTPENDQPVRDLQAKYDLGIEVNGRRRPLNFQDGDCYVTLREGETYAIVVANRTSQRVHLRLLVDGLNTLPHGDETAPISHLQTARSWILDPSEDGYRVSGFVESAAADGAVRPFTVVRADQSVAGRRKKREDEIGVITAAFYSPRPAAGDVAMRERGFRLGTDFGARKNEEFTLDAKTVPGELLGVVTIRYTQK